MHFRGRDNKMRGGWRRGEEGGEWKVERGNTRERRHKSQVLLHSKHFPPRFPPPSSVPHSSRFPFPYLPCYLFSLPFSTTSHPFTQFDSFLSQPLWAPRGRRDGQLSKRQASEREHEKGGGEEAKTWPRLNLSAHGGQEVDAGDQGS